MKHLWTSYQCLEEIAERSSACVAHFVPECFIPATETTDAKGKPARKAPASEILKTTQDQGSWGRVMTKNWSQITCLEYIDYI